MNWREVGFETHLDFIRNIKGRFELDCKKDNNIKKCNCTYEPCSRKGMCCQCVEYHRKRNELPGCYFSKETERSYERSIRAYFAQGGIIK
ncbi:MAG: DUF6485 family protein [Chitinophagales bacterium]